MKSLKLCTVLFGLLFVQHCDAQTNVTGVTVDTNGKPIACVQCAISGFGGHLHYSGMQTFVLTDNEGHFSIPLPRGDPLVDLQFDAGGHAPVFLYKVRPVDSPLRVVMSKGKVLRGRVVERLKDKIVPIPHATVQLQMPQDDFWYQRNEPTDTKGEFQFNISEPPAKWPWTLFIAGKQFPVDYAQVTPETVLVLEVSVRMTASSEPDAAANGSQPIRSETNSTPSAAGSRR